MRVIHLLRKYDPSQWGGTETATQRLLDGLRENGVDSVVYCPRLDDEPISDPLKCSGHRVERFKAFVPVLGLSDKRKRELVAMGGNLMSFDLIQSLWRETRASVIHTHALGRIGGIGLTIAKQRQLPFVVSVHGGVFDLPDKLRQSFNAPVSGGWEWGKLFGLLLQSHRLFVDADAILTCNVKEAELLRQKYPNKRVVVQPHGVPVAMYQKDFRQAALEAFPAIQGRRLLLTIGRIDPVKNQQWLVEQAPAIFAKYPDTLMVFAGACTNESYGEEIENMIREKGLQDKIILAGGLPPNDPRLIGLLQEATVLLLPSVSETFGLVVLEAWATGTMVISSRTSGARALVRHGENGWLFDLDQPQTFHDAVRQALTQPAAARKLLTRSTETVRSEFSLEAVASRMKSLYSELVEEKLCVT
jgi:starch synthase